MNITDLHPLNAVGLVLNGSMLLTLVICISLGRCKLSQRRKSRPAVTLLTQPRECLIFFRHLSQSPSLRVSASSAAFTLPPLTQEDRL